jgi:hypothetical protein
MSHEFSPQQNTQELWDASLRAIQAAGPNKGARLLDHSISTIPPDSHAPEQIILTHWSDGSWTDKFRTLAITALGPVSYEYSVVSWNPPVPEDDMTDVYGSDAPATFEYLQRLTGRLRSE